jgi:hypothetical protein
MWQKLGKIHLRKGNAKSSSCIWYVVSLLEWVSFINSNGSSHLEIFFLNRGSPPHGSKSGSLNYCVRTIRLYTIKEWRMWWVVIYSKGMKRMISYFPYCFVYQIGCRVFFKNCQWVLLALEVTLRLHKR